MITLYNDFHRTEVNIRASVGDTLTLSQVKRARRVLCGSRTCQCSGVLGTRGGQTVVLEPEYYGDGRQTYRVMADEGIG